MAPFDGMLGLRKVSVGDYVNPGQDLVNSRTSRPLKVDFRVPEIYAMQLKAGQAISVTLDAIPAALPMTARSTRSIRRYDPNGRAVILRARLPNTRRHCCARACSRA